MSNQPNMTENSSAVIEQKVSKEEILEKAQKLYKDIMDSWNNPESYAKSVSVNKIGSDQEFNLHKLLEKVKEMENQGTKVTKETFITMVLPIFIDILCVHKDIDTTGLDIYIGEFYENFITNRTNVNVCSFFELDEEYYESLKSKDHVSKVYAVDILKLMTCKQCKLFKMEHVVCNKYYEYEGSSELRESTCKICGRDHWEHKACMKFTYSNKKDVCETCGTIRRYHLNLLESKDILCCNIFKDDDHGYCLTCMYPI